VGDQSRNERMARRSNLRIDGAMCLGSQMNETWSVVKNLPSQSSTLPLAGSLITSRSYEWATQMST
jgi:hypothetical protein